MVKINNILSLVAISSFYTLAVGKPVESDDYCKDLGTYLKTQNFELLGCNVGSGDSIFVEIEGSSINQEIVDKIATYNGTFESVFFESVTTFPKDLNLESIKTNELEFTNQNSDEKKEIYIPQNILKTVKNVPKFAIRGYNISQKNINDIGSLTNLSELIINDCTVDRNVDYTNLKNLKKLTTLDLESLSLKGKGDKKLNQLPESICQLTKLKNLTIKNNDLTTLPKCIKKLKNLENLYVTRNRLTSVPKEIGNLTKLKILSLSENELETLPIDIGKLSNLEKLYLNSNEFSTLPVELSYLSKLKVLQLNENSLSTLPNEFNKLTNLKELRLSKNLFAKVPLVIGKLSNLEVLHMNKNMLRGISTVIPKLSNLKSLNLSNNKITIIPSIIGKLTNLETLNIANNQIKITNLSIAIGDLEKLNTLNLSGNGFDESDIPESFKDIPHLIY